MEVNQVLVSRIQVLVSRVLVSRILVSLRTSHRISSHGFVAAFDLLLDLLNFISLRWSMWQCPFNIGPSPRLIYYRTKQRLIGVRGNTL